MVDATKRKNIENLLKEAGEAHHQAYLDADGKVASELPGHIGDLHDFPAAMLNAHFTQSELVYLLVALDREVQRVAPGADWQAYYARVLLERYS